MLLARQVKFTRLMQQNNVFLNIMAFFVFKKLNGKKKKVVRALRKRKATKPPNTKKEKTNKTKNKKRC
jgi:hypothetical protein